MRIQHKGKRIQISNNNRVIGGKIKNVQKNVSNMENLNNEFSGLYGGKKTIKKKNKKLVLKL